METPLKLALQSVTPEAYQNLKRAVELGKWQDGSLLSVKQREHALQLVIGYESLHLTAEQRSGYMPPQTCKTKELQEPPAEPVRFDP